MGGRHGNFNKTLKIRYRTKGRKHSFRINGDSEHLKGFKHGHILRIRKVSREEILRVAEHNPMIKEPLFNPLAKAVKQQWTPPDMSNVPVLGKNMNL